MKVKLIVPTLPPICLRPHVAGLLSLDGTVSRVKPGGQAPSTPLCDRFKSVRLGLCVFLSKPYLFLLVHRVSQACARVGAASAAFYSFHPALVAEQLGMKEACWLLI